jgi:hypothetical protein
MTYLKSILRLFSVSYVVFIQPIAGDDALVASADWEFTQAAKAADRIREMGTALGLADKAVTAAADLILQQWEQTPDPLGLLLAQLATIHPETRSLLAAFDKGAVPPDPLLLERLPTKLSADLRVFAGRQLVRQRLYDEGLEWLAPVDGSATSDPVALLFFRAVCRHALWDKPELAVEDLQKLLRREKELPARYRMTAQLMLADLRPRGTDDQRQPLDEISRAMQDVGRRLDLGRADEPVIKKEKEIIEKLDKMIEQLEQQLQKQRQQRSQGSGKPSGNGQEQPMQDSQIAGGGGLGDVDKKDLGERKNWGDLPPAEREAALQKFGQQLPSHYREVIEGYFRKLATEPTAN